MRSILLLPLLLVPLGACRCNCSERSTGTAGSAAATVSASSTGADTAAPAAKPVNLVDAALWRGWNKPDVPDGWVFEGDTIHLAHPGAGDLITRQKYQDFVLELSWKIAPKGNSGILFHATEEGNAIYESAPEMQVLDDAAFPDVGPLHMSGANYALNPAPPGVSRPAGEWNDVKIVVRGPRVEQYQNGVHLFGYDLWSPEWKKLVAASKFAAWPIYGMAKTGYIGLQDHGAEVWFKDVRVTPLD